MSKTPVTTLDMDASRFLNIQIQRTQAMMHRGPEGMKGFAQMSLLEFIASQSAPPSPGDCEEALGIKSNRVACILNDLEKKEFVRREADPNDGRKTVLTVTDLGAQSINHAREELNRAVASLKQYLGPERFEMHLALCQEAMDWAEQAVRMKEDEHVQDV